MAFGSGLTVAQLREAKRDVARLKSIWLEPPDPREQVWKHDAATWAEERLDLVLDDWQCEVVNGEGHTLILASRQAGKSTCCAVLATHSAIYPQVNPRTGEPITGEVIITARSEQQAQILLRKTKEMAYVCGLDVSAEGASHLVMHNGCRILAIGAGASGGHSLRGYSPRLVVADEAAYLEDAAYSAALPSLAISGGRFVALSSAGEARGFYYEQWVDPSSPWKKVEAHYSQIRRYDPEQLERDRRMMGIQFLAEYENQFLDVAGMAPISLPAAKRALNDEIDTVDLSDL